MVMQTSESGDGSRPVIRIEGDFDFSSYREFRESYRHLAPGSALTIDLSSAEYMDSAALGMLMMLKEHMGGNPDNVTIRVSNSPEIRRVLEVARFDELFRLE